MIEVPALNLRNRDVEAEPVSAVTTRSSRQANGALPTGHLVAMLVVVLAKLRHSVSLHL